MYGNVFEARPVDQNAAGHQTVFEGDDIVFLRAPARDHTGGEAVIDVAVEDKVRERVEMRGVVAVIIDADGIDRIAARPAHVETGGAHDVLPGVTRKIAATASPIGRRLGRRRILRFGRSLGRDIGIERHGYRDAFFHQAAACLRLALVIRLTVPA
jgi:hypothetical protein